MVQCCGYRRQRSFCKSFRLNQKVDWHSVERPTCVAGTTKAMEVDGTQSEREQRRVWWCDQGQDPLVGTDGRVSHQERGATEFVLVLPRCNIGTLQLCSKSLSWLRKNLKYTHVGLTFMVSWCVLFKSKIELHAKLEKCRSLTNTRMAATWYVTLMQKLSLPSWFYSNRHRAWLLSLGPTSKFIST